MFRNELKTELTPNSNHRLLDNLIYDSELVGRIIVPTGFETDFASVPRLPIAYWVWGDRAHREAVIHDYLYRIDCDPNVSYSVANKIFLEAMKSRDVSIFIRWPMYSAVCACGWTSFHKKRVFDEIK